MKCTLGLITLILFSTLSGWSQKPTSRFEGFATQKDQAIDGTNKLTSFKSGWVTLYADTTLWSTWTGWAVSSMTDIKTPDFTNQHSAIVGTGINGSLTYAVGFDQPKMSIGKAQPITGMFITNSTYAFHTIKDGNRFTKKFGGDSGEDKDSFVVRANGFLEGKETRSVDFFLADYRFEKQSDDYVVADWTWWDLSNLGDVDSLTFEFFSSDVGDFGINTPKYFCMDNFLGTPPSTKVAENDFESLVVNEKGIYNGEDQLGGFYTSGAYFINNYNSNWNSWDGFSFSNNSDTKTEGTVNQYSSFVGSGVYDSDQFLVAHAQGPLTIELPYTKEGTPLLGTYLTNNTYAALSMKNGDKFAKKFGGDSGNDEDWMKAEIVGYDYNNKKTGSVEYYLADYRFSDNSEDYVVDSWEWIDLSPLGSVTRVEIVLSSSDTSEFGMNTPAYICLDDFNSLEPLSNNEIAFSSPFDIYPNPAMNQFAIAGLDEDAPFEIKVFDLSGSLLITETSKTQLDVKNFPCGNYLVRINQDAEVRHLKLSKI